MRRSTIWMTVAGVVLALLVILPLLPGTDATSGSIQWGTTTMALFVGGAVLTVATVAFALVRATRRSGH